MRADFEALPDFAKKRLLDMLGAPGTPEREPWNGFYIFSYIRIVPEKNKTDLFY